MSFEIKGLDDVERNLKNLASRAEKLDGQHNVPISELLTPSFVSACSRFNSAEELFQASGFKIESTEDFEAIPDAAWDKFIKSSTSFGDWSELLKAATVNWTNKQLGL